MALSNKNQIIVLEDVKQRLASGRNKSLREAVYNSSRKLFKEVNCIKLFTFANAQLACKIKKVKMPNRELRDWFEDGNKTSRYAFINWMIDELKTK